MHGSARRGPDRGPVLAALPWPAVSHEPRIQKLSDDLTAAGYHPFHAPCGIMLDEADRPASACIRCASCDGYPCLVHAKADAEVIAVRPLLGRPNVTLLVNSEVTRLQTSPSGRTVTGVVVQRDGNEEVYAGDIVVVCAGAAGTARILLQSANDQHPAGLANGSDQVGRNYMFHNSRAVLALSREPNDTVYQKTLAINDFYLAGAGRQWPLGNIQMLGKSNAEAMRGEEPVLTKLAPQLALTDVAKHGVDFWLTTEDLPLPGNRVTVDDQGRTHLAYTATNGSEADGLYKRAVHHPQSRRDGRAPRAGQELLHEDGHPAGRGRPSGRDLPVRHRPSQLGPGPGLPGARARQPLRGRRQLLPEHRGGEPGPDRHGQRAARR